MHKPSACIILSSRTADSKVYPGTRSPARPVPFFEVMLSLVGSRVPLLSESESS